MKIAIIGTGIAGLSAAWLLNKNHDITVFEASDSLGGYANTVEVPGHPAIDTGFITFNDRVCPNLIKLFEHFEVSSVQSDMTFSVSMNEKSYEYSTNALFTHKSNLFNPKHLGMLLQVVKFNKAVESNNFDTDETLGKYLARKKYSSSFAKRYLYPLVSTIWAFEYDKIAEFPMAVFADVFRRNGFHILDRKGMTRWHTVGGGAFTYVEALAEEFKSKIHLKTRITDVIRHKDFIEIVQQGGKTQLFEQVVLAVNCNEAQKILARMTEDEKEVLNSFPHRMVKSYLHQDQRLMPANKKNWAGWNFLQQEEDKKPYVTKWINLLQPFIDRGQNYFISMDPPYEPSDVLHETEYAFPQFNSSVETAWHNISHIQGIQRTWFCGAWCGYGFHEDALSAGLAVGEALGGAERPWIVSETSPAGENCKPVYE